MDTYEGNIYDPDTLHKYLYANGNPVKYTDPSGNFSSVAQAAANAINHVLTTAYNVNLMGLVSGIGKMYNLEVLYDEISNTVYHFEYARKAMGNLPAIPK